MNRNTIFGTLGVGLLLILMALVSQQEVNSSNSLQASSQIKESEVNQATTKIQMSQLADANNRFGFNLFNRIQSQQPQENIVISPNSIAIALAMARRGTSKETLAEITTALELNRLDAANIDASYSELIKTLKNADPNVNLAIANSLWVNRDITLKQEFINDAQKFYLAEVNNLDFATPQAADIINDWVAKNTADKIPQIVDSLSPEDALYLINAIYFKGSWSNQFDPEATTQAPFYTEPNSPQPHQMMNQTGDYRYYENEQFQAVKIPYGKNQELGMYIFLPQETNDLETFNQQLNINNWQEWLAKMRSRKGNITIPRFELEYETELQDVLSALGIKLIFNSAQADFSAMTDASVAIDNVKHKTFIEVNEEGTEAAAVTSIGIRVTSVEPEDIPFNMNVNRPFFFAIGDDITNSILFMGNVVEP